MESSISAGDEGCDHFGLLWSKRSSGHVWSPLIPIAIGAKKRAGNLAVLGNCGRLHRGRWTEGLTRRRGERGARPESRFRIGSFWRTEPGPKWALEHHA